MWRRHRFSPAWRAHQIAPPTQRVAINQLAARGLGAGRLRKAQVAAGGAYICISMRLVYRLVAAQQDLSLARRHRRHR